MDTKFQPGRCHRRVPHTRTIHIARCRADDPGRFVHEKLQGGPDVAQRRARRADAADSSRQYPDAAPAA